MHGGGEAEAGLAAREGGRGLHERRSVAEGAQPPLLGEELLVGHGINVVREREGGAVTWTTTNPQVILVAGKSVFNQ